MYEFVDILRSFPNLLDAVYSGVITNLNPQI